MSYGRAKSEKTDEVTENNVVFDAILGEVIQEKCRNLSNCT